MILHACEHTQLTFHCDPIRMGVFYDFPGQGNVLFVRKTAAVYHDGGVAAVNTGFDTLQAFSVVQVQRDRNRAVLSTGLHCVTDGSGPFLLFLNGAVHKIGGAAHIGIGGLRSLQDGAGMEQLMNPNGSFDLPVTVHVEGALTVMIRIRGFQDGSHGYQHVSHLSFFNE